jgi:glutathione S-transferase
MLKVWGRASSANVQCVMWCIAELNLPVERVDAGLMYGVNNSEEYLRMNPNGTVPTLIDGNGPPLWESGAVVRYLVNAYGKHPFWPEDFAARTEVDRWAEWGKVSVQMPFNSSIFWPVIRLPASERNEQQVTGAIQQFERKLEIADDRLSRQTYLAGEHLTPADIQFGHILYRYFELEIERRSLPNVRRYYDALTGMPNYQQHVMINFDELRPK